MHLTNHALIGRANRIPAPDPQPVLSFSPVILPFPARRYDLQLRVVAPITGQKLPIVILSHGHGPYLHLSSLEGYAPLAEFWASRGFVIIQPTHLSSKTYNIPFSGPDLKELMLVDRVNDISRIIDSLDEIETLTPLLKQRMDKTQIALAGHSLGALTTQTALGVVNEDPTDGTKFDGFDARIKAGIIMAGTGRGGSEISGPGQQWFSFYGPDFSTMRRPALTVWGDRDVSPHLTTRGADWHNDPHTMAPGPRTSLKVTSGYHNLGGIVGYDATAVQDDENPEILGFVQRMTLAYLRSHLYNDDSWKIATEALKSVPGLGSVEEKV